MTPEAESAAIHLTHLLWKGNVKLSEASQTADSLVNTILGDNPDPKAVAALRLVIDAALGSPFDVVQERAYQLIVPAFPVQGKIAADV